MEFVGEWQATEDHMPGKPARLTVTGTCRFPTAGWSVALRVHEPPPINTRMLMLDVVVTEPEGPVPEVITDVPVSYETPVLGDGDPCDFDQVHIGVVGIEMESFLIDVDCTS